MQKGGLLGLWLRLGLGFGFGLGLGLGLRLKSGLRLGLGLWLTKNNSGSFLKTIVVHFLKIIILYVCMS